MHKTVNWYPVPPATHKLRPHWNVQTNQEWTCPWTVKASKAASTTPPSGIPALQDPYGGVRSQRKGKVDPAASPIYSPDLVRWSRLSFIASVLCMIRKNTIEHLYPCVYNYSYVCINNVWYIIHTEQENNVGIRYISESIYIYDTLANVNDVHYAQYISVWMQESRSLGRGLASVSFRIGRYWKTHVM